MPLTESLAAIEYPKTGPDVLRGLLGMVAAVLPVMPLLSLLISLCDEDLDCWMTALGTEGEVELLE